MKFTSDQIEKTSHHFNLETFLKSQTLAKKCVHLIASQVSPGMTEEQATLLAKKTLLDQGIKKNWHRTLVRLGENTVCTYRDHSKTNVILKPEDIFFIDIGTVLNDHEGDAGDTFCVGENKNYLKCKQDVKTLFEITKDYWQKNHPTGVKLYQFALEQSEKMGWLLNLTAGGHRLSEFPHSVHFKGSLQEVPFKPSPHVWILEIQIKHPTENFGGFYEDLLM